MNDFGPRFTEAEQREIIQHAAQLQAAHRETLSEQDLVSAAAELGIDRQFVQQATDRVLESKMVEERFPQSLTVLIPLLLVANWLGVFSMMSGHLAGWAGLQWWLVFALSFSVGSVLSKGNRRILVALGFTLCTLTLASLLCGPFVGYLGGGVSDNWPTYLRNIFSVEAFATVAGVGVGQALHRLLCIKPKQAAVR